MKVFDYNFTEFCALRSDLKIIIGIDTDLTPSNPLSEPMMV